MHWGPIVVKESKVGQFEPAEVFFMILSYLSICMGYYTQHTISKNWFPKMQVVIKYHLLLGSGIVQDCLNLNFPFRLGTPLEHFDS